MVTPRLWREEAARIAGAAASDNMTVRVRDSVREVVATYSIDEGSMELVVALPGNHPLGGLAVESGKRVGVETGHIFQLYSPNAFGDVIKNWVFF